MIHAKALHRILPRLILLANTVKTGDPLRSRLRPIADLLSRKTLQNN
jgi:hypothetical protein